jgi:high-affinity K+ transport system ATPase subunit B
VEKFKDRRLLAAMNWMAGLSLALFWLPGIGSLAAGLVGGWKAGSVRTALVAAFLPAILNAVLAAVGVAYLTHWIGWGVLAGFGAAVWSLTSIGPLLLGAMVGSLVASRVG